jgi:hypothetical protein
MHILRRLYLLYTYNIDSLQPSDIWIFVDLAVSVLALTMYDETRSKQAHETNSYDIGTIE